MKKPREEAVTKMQKKPLVHSTLSTGYERLERAMAHSGLASRREAKDLIVQGLVSVNGTVIRAVALQAIDLRRRF